MTEQEKDVEIEAMKARKTLEKKKAYVKSSFLVFFFCFKQKKLSFLNLRIF